MRFFTLAWWRGDDESGGDADAPAAYGQHLDGIRDRLPADLIDLEDSGDLQDARLLTLSLLTAQAGLRIELETYEADARLILIYTGVEQFSGLADPIGGLGGSAGLGDLGYSEADLLPGGLLEHRLLFASGIELVVVFQMVSLERRGLPAPLS